MRIVLQKVLQASVSVDNELIGSINEGYLLFVCAMEGDTEEQGRALAEKITKLRLFDSADGPPDSNGIVRAGKINDRSLLDINGEILVVSQFTLAGRTEKGNRPDYTQAASPDHARVLYTSFIEALKSAGIVKVETGRFGAMMQVSLINSGPVTLILER